MTRPLRALWLSLSRTPGSRAAPFELARLDITMIRECPIVSVTLLCVVDMGSLVGHLHPTMNPNDMEVSGVCAPVCSEFSVECTA